MANHLTSFQMAAIALGALDIAVMLGGPMIRALKQAGVGQRVRDDGPQRHLEKEGTPTMGGVLIIGAAVAAALLGSWWAVAGVGLELLVLVAVTGAFAAIGLADDWRKIKRGRSLGLRARDKLALQFLAGAAFVYALAGQRALSAATPGETSGGALTAAAGVFWLLAMVATSNAVNLADGLDGLAAGLCTLAALGFAALGVHAGRPEVTIFALALAGGCFGFLLFNRHPAKVFMGDVGALALGAAMAGMAAWLNQPLALIGFCLVPFIEEGSVILQVVSFKTRGKRIFKMSPIHHHFELSGWPEQRVVVTFWAVALLVAAATVVLVR
jgi:phospho-N-acetylmuramoyl-pentapeptide-transferase